MIDIQIVSEFMYQYFEQTTLSSNSTHFLARCILCGDSKKNPYKKRFNLDWNNGNPGYHCFNCGRRGSFIKIYSIVKGISYDDAKKEIFKYDKDRIKRIFSKCKKSEKNKIIEENNFNWIKSKCYERLDYIPEELGILENKYLRELENFYNDRKIPDKYKIYICHSGKYKNRIIIPIFNKDNDIIYFQARRVPKFSIEPKYDNPVSPKELCILNKHMFDKNKSIIVCEGLIDAFMIGDQGTACLGKEISEELIKELLKYTDKDIIIALDNDSEGYKALYSFMSKNNFSRKVKFFLYPSYFNNYKDINSYCKEKKENINMYELITENSVNYSTAYTKLHMLKLFGGNNEINKHRNRYHKSK